MAESVELASISHENDRAQFCTFSTDASICVVIVYFIYFFVFGLFSFHLAAIGLNERVIKRTGEPNVYLIIIAKALNQKNCVIMFLDTINKIKSKKNIMFIDKLLFYVYDNRHALDSSEMGLYFFEATDSFHWCVYSTTELMSIQ